MTAELSAASLKRSRIAESSVADLYRSVDFWLRQKKFLLVVLAGIAIILRLAPYTYDFADGWVIFTVGAQLLAMWGGFVTARGLAALEVENAIVGEIEAKGAAYLRDLKSGRRNMIDLDKLEEDVLPNNLSTPTPAMIRLFQHICKEARDRRFESSVNLVQPYREEPLEDIFKLQNLQKIALWIGILGTFVGLLLAMRVENFENLEGGEDFMLIIKEMFGNLFVSFSASLAGLEAAVILGFFVLLLRKKQELYFKNMETAVVTMLSVARNTINRDTYLSEFRQLRETLDELSTRVFNQTEVVSTRISSIQESVIRQTGEIQHGIGALAAARSEFDGFLKQIGRSQREFIDDVRGVYDAISLKTLGPTLQASVADSLQHVSGALNSQVTALSSQIAEFNNSVGLLSSAIERQSAAATDYLSRLEGGVAARVAENTDAVKTVGRQMRADLHRLEAQADRDVSGELRELSRKVSAVREVLERSRRASALTRLGYRFRALLSHLRW